jgi:hypothetical protein
MPVEPSVEAPPAPPPEAGNVRLGAAMMLGGEGISKGASDAASKAFVSTFEAGISHFRQCYAPGLSKNPALEGSVDVRVILGADGSIYELNVVHAALDDANVVQCLVQAFRKLRYAPLSDGQYFSVTAPLKLKPQ